MKISSFNYFGNPVETKITTTNPISIFPRYVISDTSNTKVKEAAPIRLSLEAQWLKICF